MIAEYLREIGAVTPPEAKPPKGRLVFEVKAHDKSDEESKIFVAVPPTHPEMLGSTIFNNLPNTVDYCFEQVDAKDVASAARNNARTPLIRQLLALVLTPESIQLELKKDS